MLDESGPVVKYKSQSSGTQDGARHHWQGVTEILKYLRQSKWIKTGDSDQAFKAADIIGVDPLEAYQIASLIFKKYLRTLDIHYVTHATLIRLVGITHLDGRSYVNFKRILTAIHKAYGDKTGPDKEFVSFYNRVLSKLFDFHFINASTTSVIELEDCPWLGVNELTQRFEWKPARQIYYIEDKPAYEILPENIRKIIQPHFSNRDKNRFGQIGKRIGLNFKRIIEQKLTKVAIIKTMLLWEYFPSFADSLALVETLLETNLDARLNDIKKVDVVVCKHFEVELYKDGQRISSLNALNYKIESDPSVKLYVRDALVGNTGTPYANMLHDLLVELLNRDLNTVRLTLNDFYNRSSKRSFVTLYEVAPERIEEIELRLKGFSVTKMQSFWLTILRLKNVESPQSYLSGKHIDMDLALAALGIASPEIDGIDYGQIYKIENLTLLQSLFESLQLDVGLYNEHADVKIDFSEYYLKQLQGLKFEYRKNFEVALYDSLIHKSIEEKASFQDQAEAYSNRMIQLKGPLLFFDAHAFFFQLLQNQYPALQLTGINAEERKKELLLKFHKSESEFRNRAASVTRDKRTVDEFLLLNTNRSLLYFEGTLAELEKRLHLWTAKPSTALPTGNPDIRNSLAQYTNPPGVLVEKPGMSAVPHRISQLGSGGGGGSRVDGSQNNPDTDFSGMVAEKLVYELLLKSYSSTEWVSRNAAKAGVNPEGSDQYGCDITYVDEKGQPQYVEVKSSTSDEKRFFVTFTEYNNAEREQENYHFYMVFFTLNNGRRRIIDLGNIFMLDEGEEVFRNKQFSANFTNLEIRFQ